MQNHYSAFEYQDLAQAQSAQLITPTPSNIGSVVGVNTSKWRDYGCTISGTGATFIKKSRHS